jgi:hypothetical protein
MGIMTDQPQQQEATQDEDATTAWKAFRTLSFVAWMSLSGFFGLEVLEFGAAVDGVGYAHTSVPSLVTVGVAHILAVTVALPAVAVYRGRIGYMLGAGLGLVFWIVSFILGAWSLDYHYERVCETMLAPSACEYVAKIDEDDCVPYADSECADAIVRACTLGDPGACNHAVEKGVLPQSQACNALADKCDEAKRCNSHNPPPACGGPDVPRLDELRMSRVCEAFEERCGE